MESLLGSFKVLAGLKPLGMKSGVEVENLGAPFFSWWEGEDLSHYL
jgi:hypothetical protein